MRRETKPNASRAELNQCRVIAKKKLLALKLQFISSILNDNPMTKMCIIHNSSHALIGAAQPSSRRVVDCFLYLKRRSSLSYLPTISSLT